MMRPADEMNKMDGVAVKTQSFSLFFSIAIIGEKLENVAIRNLLIRLPNISIARPFSVERY